MSTRSEVIELLNELSEDDLHALETYARYLKSGSKDDLVTWVLDNAPEEDEPITEEEERAVAEARDDIRHGRLISAEEAKRILLG